MMHIVMLRARPKRQKVMQTPWELIPTVRINGLKQPTYNPEIHRQDVEVSGDGAPYDGASDGPETQDHDLNGRSVLSGHAEGRGVLMVDLVDIFVKRAPMQCTMRPVVPCVFEDEEKSDLVCQCEEGREGNAGCKAKVLSHWVEEPR